MAVKIYKLSTGETILCDSEDGQTDQSVPVQVRRPLLMIFNEQGIRLAMWCPADMSEPVLLNRSLIVAECHAVEPLANEYRSKFGGIVTAPAGLVTPP